MNVATQINNPTTAPETPRERFLSLEAPERHWIAKNAWEAAHRRAIEWWRAERLGLNVKREVEDAGRETC